MNILFINQTFYPDVVSTAQHLTDLAVDLARQGHQVTVLTGRRGYTEPHPLYPPAEVYQGIVILRVWPFTFGRQNKIARMADFLFLNLAFAWRLLWMPRFDCVIAMTTPPLVGWIGYLFSKLRKSQFVYWMMDINPDQGIELGWIKKDSFQAKMLESALRIVLKGSSKIVVLDRFMKERITAKGADPQKIAVIPPWSHDEDLETIPHDKNPFRQKHGLDEKFVVMYSGNLSICHPLDTLLQAALQLKKDPSVVFMFIGGGERVKDVLQFKQAHQLDNIIYLPYQNRSEIKYSLSAADLHTVVMGDPYVGIVHPCKIYGILKIGRPFLYIGPEASHIGDLIQEEQTGYQVNHGDAQQVVEIIKTVKNLELTQKNEIQKREQFIAEKFSRKKISRHLVSTVT